MRMPPEDFRDSVAIVGIGYSRSPSAPGGFSKNSGESVTTLTVRAAREAAADAGMDPKDIDAGVTYQTNDSIDPQAALRALGVRRIHQDTSLTGGGNYASASIMMGAQIIYHGMADYCLVYRSMNGRSGYRMGQSGAGAGGGSNRVGGAGQFQNIYGLAGPPSTYAQQARRYMGLYDVSSADLAEWTVNSRSNAVKNPRATMRDPVTVEDHQNSRYIVNPYHLLDCCLETDVACAMILTSTERAKSMRKTPLLIRGAIGGPSPFEDLADTGFKYMRDQLFGAADIQLSDIDIALLYDNFTDCPMRMVEDIGWCGKGECADFVRSGAISLDGQIPMETQGGLINEGYCHGLNNALEAAQQLWGEAEDLCPNWADGEHSYDRDLCRQTRDPKIALHTGVVGKSALVMMKAD